MTFTKSCCPNFVYDVYSDRSVKVTLWSFWSRQVGGYFLLDYSVTYLLSCFVLCCTCLMFDCVRKVVDSLVCHKQSKQISTGFAKFSR